MHKNPCRQASHCIMIKNGPLTCLKFKDSESFDPCQPARTAQADMEDTFRKCIKPPFQRTWIKCNWKSYFFSL